MDRLVLILIMSFIGIFIQAVYMGYRLDNWKSLSIAKRISSFILGGISAAVVGFFLSGQQKISDDILIVIMMLAAAGGGEFFVLLTNGALSEAARRINKALGGDKNE